jgi:hypothetical protein
MHRYTMEQIVFLRDWYRRLSREDLTAAFNHEFGTCLTIGQIVGTLKNYKLRSLRTGRFMKGHAPWNRGTRGLTGANPGSFQPGNLPHNHRPLWSERVIREGYLEISVPERNPYTGFPTRFKGKHVWIWEQAHGPVPEGHVVIFRDCDNRNFALDNLLLVSRTELLVLNLHDYKNHPAETRPSVLALAKLEAKARIRTRPGRGRIFGAQKNKR